MNLLFQICRVWSHTVQSRPVGVRNNNKKRIAGIRDDSRITNRQADSDINKQRDQLGLEQIFRKRESCYWE